MKTIIVLTAFTLASCYVDEGEQAAAPKTLATAIADAEDCGYNYFRYQMKDKTTGKSVVMNFKIKDFDAEDCGELKEIEVCVDGKIEKFNEETDDDPRRWKDSIRIMSATNSKGEFDRLTIKCEDGKISVIDYNTYPSVGRFNKLTYANKEAYGRPEGKELKHYQDSECWPESKSQCEEAGSGQ